MRSIRIAEFSSPSNARPQSPKAPIATGFYVKIMLRVLWFEKIRVQIYSLSTFIDVKSSICECRMQSEVDRNHSNQKQCKESEFLSDPGKAAYFLYPADGSPPSDELPGHHTDCDWVYRIEAAVFLSQEHD
jgi:hypothetical protein